MSSALSVDLLRASNKTSRRQAKVSQPWSLDQLPPRKNILNRTLKSNPTQPHKNTQYFRKVQQTELQPLITLCITELSLMRIFGPISSIIFFKQNICSFISRRKTFMPQSQFEGHFKLHTNSAFKSAERLFT